ncbi:MAG: ABC transporter substrate-binding protein [Actinobacteria bacterium]|nr:ABC transporter substrate-binding protein [Actinomycetota bacterium]
MRHDLAGVPRPTLSGRGARARCLLAALTGLVVLTSVGCGAVARAGRPVGNTVTIAYAPGIDTAPLYMAQKNKLFAQEGLRNVILKTYPNGPAALSAVAHGQADIAASDYGDIFYAEAAKKVPGGLRVLADGFDASQGMLEVLTRPDSSIRSPADLLNSNVVIGAPSDQVLPIQNGAGQPVSLDIAAAAQVLLNFVGNDATSAKWEPMPQNQEVQELRTGQLPAILVSQPYIFQAQSQFGAVVVFDAATGPTAGLPLTGYVAGASWVEQNPTAVADFQAAIIEAQNQASMSGQVQQVLPKITTISSADADLATIGTYPASTSAAALNQVTQLLWQSKWAASAFQGLQPPDVRKMIVGPAG